LVRTGLSDEIIDQLDDYRSSDLAPSWIAALRLTDHLSGNVEGELPPDVYDDLRLHFDEAQILMLGSLLSVGSGWQRMIEAFGIKPNHYLAGQAGPWVAAD
jgi:alkylhydroperoxidase family enzyme